LLAVLQVHDDAGVPLAATFDIETKGDELTLVLHSRGETGTKARNKDYSQGLETLLRRLAELGATLEDAYVDAESKQVQKLPISERRLLVSDWSYPLPLEEVGDFDRLRKGLSRVQRMVARSPEATTTGNATRRIRLHVSIPGFSPTEDANRLGQVVTHSQAPLPLPGVWSGQGFSADTPTKLAVEQAAMKAARVHYESEQWAVSDVSAKKSFDLLCTKDDEELHVEVKGTTQAPKGVFLTANEVAHAEHPGTRVALFILSGIEISKQDGKPVASGGSKTVLDPFELKRERLTAKQYTYSLDGLA
jgi:hypothetical protein